MNDLARVKIENVPDAKLRQPPLERIEALKLICQKGNCNFVRITARDNDGKLLSVSVHIETDGDEDHDAESLMEWLESRGIEEP